SGVVEMPLQTIAEDFSQFANEVPGAFFLVGTTPAGQDPAKAPINHSPHYAPDEAALEHGAKAMLQVVLAYLGGAPGCALSGCAAAPRTTAAAAAAPPPRAPWPGRS